MAARRFRSKVDRWIFVLLVVIIIVEIVAIGSAALQAGDALATTGLILAMIGVVGLLFQELALVIVFSLCCALLVAMTVIPMLASRLLRRHEQERAPGALARVAGGVLDGLDRAYARWLARSLRHRGATLLCAFALLGVGYRTRAAAGVEDLGGYRVDPPAKDLSPTLGARW